MGHPPLATCQQPMHKNDLADMYLANVWRSSLAVTGANGIPAIAIAGNVLRPFTELRVSIRLPPNKNAKEAADAFLELLTKVYLSAVLFCVLQAQLRS